VIAVAIAAGLLALKRRALPDGPVFLRAVVAATPLGFLATEAGWIVTEVGRQPWIITGVMRTEAAVTPMPRLAIPFVVGTLLYLALAGIVLRLLARQMVATESHGKP
jgi:cytochrome d ubiquinol oxidase subunit I